MKLEYDSIDYFKVFYPCLMMDDIDYEDKKALKELLKKILVGLKKNYQISIYGFYAVKIYVLEKLGFLFLFQKIEDDLFSNQTIDLKIELHLKPNVYLSFEDYDIISSYYPIYCYENKYYLSLEILKEKDILSLSEWYTLFLDENNIIKKSQII